VVHDVVGGEPVECLFFPLANRTDPEPYERAAGLNLVVNNALGLMILLRRPYGVWPKPVARPDLKLNEKGEKSYEETVV
jgi:hypothetical protein